MPEKIALIYCQCTIDKVLQHVEKDKTLKVVSLTATRKYLQEAYSGTWMNTSKKQRHSVALHESRHTISSGDKSASPVLLVMWVKLWDHHCC